MQLSGVTALRFLADPPLPNSPSISLPTSPPPVARVGEGEQAVEEGTEEHVLELALQYTSKVEDVTLWPSQLLEASTITDGRTASAPSMGSPLLASDSSVRGLPALARTPLVEEEESVEGLVPESWGHDNVVVVGVAAVIVVAERSLEGDFPPSELPGLIILLWMGLLSSSEMQRDFLEGLAALALLADLANATASTLCCHNICCCCCCCIHQHGTRKS